MKLREEGTRWHSKFTLTLLYDLFNHEGLDFLFFFAGKMQKSLLITCFESFKKCLTARTPYIVNRKSYADFNRHKQKPDALWLAHKRENKESKLFLSLNTVNLLLLGAKYSPSKGNFAWPDNTEVVYNAWNPGEPRFGMDCSLMMNRKGWGTDRCDMERSYICKKGGLLQFESTWLPPFECKGAMSSLD